MKNIKIIVITAIICLGLATGGSVYALKVNFAGTTANTIYDKEVVPTEKRLSTQEQITKGNVYDIYTGQKLTTELSATELRFQAIEARLDKLEAKN